ncbi:hypothetical protein BpHYR1_036288 [Brachionus plicatilis]|uniref:Uncharacterized protein n=1 Tax=Brachionus plicatilis TaxID=10195 RepID=A0A3M7RR87_BRAPC|nr:hypothetical protein BpHYR1_036288 [Brachionus plicatilis]
MLRQNKLLKYSSIERETPSRSLLMSVSKETEEHRDELKIEEAIQLNLSVSLEDKGEPKSTQNGKIYKKDENYMYKELSTIKAEIVSSNNRKISRMKQLTKIEIKCKI